DATATTEFFAVAKISSPLAVTQTFPCSKTRNFIACFVDAAGHDSFRLQSPPACVGMKRSGHIDLRLPFYFFSRFTFFGSRFRSWHEFITGYVYVGVGRLIGSNRTIGNKKWIQPSNIQLNSNSYDFSTHPRSNDCIVFRTGWFCSGTSRASKEERRNQKVRAP